MLRSFKDKDTEAIWRRRNVKAMGPELVKAVYKKLAILDAAGNINDLRVPPGNRLEKLRGDREGQHSIRVNDQYRICFVWKHDGAEDVELTDYH